MIEIITPSGSRARGQATYTTAISEVRIRGYAVGATSISVEYDGYTYTSGSGDVYLGGAGDFVFPHPENYESGVDLISGVNTFQIRADQVSEGSPFGSVNVVLTAEVTNLLDPPTGLRVERRTNAIELFFPHVDPEVLYYNIYASNVSGGGLDGYAKINFDPIDPQGYGSRRENSSAIETFSRDISAQEASRLFLDFKVVQKEGLVEELEEHDLKSVFVPEGASRLRITTLVSSVDLVSEVSFLHNRNANISFSPRTNLIGRLSSLPVSAPVYYVVTAVKLVEGVEVESRYSAEVAGTPIPVTPSNTSIPNVSREQLTRDMVSSIFLAQPDVSVQVGSVIRDVVIDPFVSEMERSRFLLDFAYRSSSFTGLLQIDDPQNTGSSLAVENSSYKTALKSALFLQSNQDVQDLIDGAFEKLASNYGVTRKRGTSAVGEVSFYTTTPPTFTLTVPRGTTVTGSGQSFITTQGATILLDEASRYYNPVTKRYSITLPISSLDLGSAGNLTTGKINSGAPLGLLVTNPSPTFGGQDTETNLELATRALGVLSALDVGTKAGYERLSRGLAGVSASFVVGAGERYMKRDGGLGGKVDVWVKGESLTSVSDVFAPSFQSNFGSRFIPVGLTGSYRFRSVSATVESPISEMIDREFISTRFGLRNTSQGGVFFDLTGYVVEDYRTIVLDSSLAQPSYNLTDVLLGDWRAPSSQEVVFSRQPVRSVISAVREDGVTELDYTFKNNADPFLEGGSSLDKTSITLSNPDGYTILEVSEEAHTIVGFYEERLGKIGIDPLSLIVTSYDKATTYISPYDGSNPDYIILDDEQGLISIKRTEGSAIRDGSVVLISYRYLENITVTYETNLVVANAQREIDANKNITADVLVKETRGLPLSIQATVLLERGYSSVDVNALLQYNLSSFILNSAIGGEIRPSEIIKEINNTEGVSHVRLPLTRMSFKGGSQVLREEVLIGAGGYEQVASLSNGVAYVWVISSRLLSTPVSGGGERARVYLINETTGDERLLTLLDASQRESSASWVVDSASILGESGSASISDGDSKLLLGLAIGEDPSEYRVEVSYEVADRVEVISEAVLNNFSYFEVGDITFTFEEA